MVLAQTSTAKKSGEPVIQAQSAYLSIAWSTYKKHAWWIGIDLFSLKKELFFLDFSVSVVFVAIFVQLLSQNFHQTSHSLFNIVLQFVRDVLI